MGPGSQLTQTTYRFELWRASSAGILETAGTTFLLTIALQYFEAGPFSKAIVAGAGSLGLLLSPLVVSMVTSAGWATGRAGAIILAFGSLGFLAAAFFDQLFIFVVCSVIAMATSAAVIPLLTQMYHDNYPQAERGRRFSRTVMIRIAVAAVFSKIAGDALDGRLHEYHWLLLTFALALGFAAFCLSRCPTQPIHDDGQAHPFRAMRFLKTDPLFRRVLVAWMLMGFANLMMLPLRIEYLANPKHHADGKAATIATIALLTGVLPNLARLFLSPVWGHLFDRVNFFTLRMILNLGFALGILTFFTTGTFTGLVIGSLIYGISNAGGEVAWSLWVTKFAPPGRVADYMSVHTFLTGVRGVLAPIIAFQVVHHFSIGLMAWVSTAVILVATILLLPGIRPAETRKSSEGIVGEICD